MVKSHIRKVIIAVFILPVFLSTLFCCCLSMMIRVNASLALCHQDQTNHATQYPCHKDRLSDSKSCYCEHVAAITKHQIAEASNIINAAAHESTVSLLAARTVRNLFSVTQHLLAHLSLPKIIDSSVPLYLLNRVLRL